VIARYGVSFRCRYKSYIPSSLVEATPGVHPAWARRQFSAAAQNKRRKNLCDFMHRDSSYRWTLARNSAHNLSAARTKKVGLADWRTSNGLPSASDPETEADRTPRESLLACMTANR
jgi:hypothetical protein